MFYAGWMDFLAPLKLPMDFGGLNSSNAVIHIQDVIVKSCKLQIFCEDSRWKPRASLRHTSPICPFSWPKIIDWKSRTCRTTEAKASTLAPQRPHSLASEKRLATGEFSKFLARGIERHGLLVSIYSLFPLASLTQASWPLHVFMHFFTEDAFGQF